MSPQHPHLDRNHRQICLIRLTNSKPEPSNPGYYWRFEAHHVSLDSPNLPPFTAFSYLWGKPKPGFHRIAVHDRFRDITPNLHAAIESLIKIEDLSGQWLWIDAICIDQTDLNERASQVALMRDLYARAHRTVAYLGPEGEAGGLGVGLCWLEELGNAWTTQPDPVGWLESAATSDRHDVEWRTLNAVFDREWWRRAWILQETVTSRNMHFTFGRVMISCEALQNALLLLRAATPAAGLALLARGVWMDGDRSGRFNAIYKRFHLRWWYHHHGRLSLGSLVSQRYHFLAGDPRDYVYAIFALVEKTGAAIASPDYAVETWQAYAAFVKKYAEAYGNLDVLCLATSPSELAELPSWAPDLTYRNAPGRTFVHEDSLWLMNLDAEEALKKERNPGKQRATYRAAGTSSADVTFSADLRVLASRAIYIDTVDGLSGHRHLVTPPPGRSFIQVHSTMPDVQPQHNTSAYGTQAKTCEALCRTLLLDRLPEFETEPAPNYATFLLAYGCAKAEAGRRDAPLTELWRTMREFRVAGRPLREWMRGDVDEAAMEETARRAVEEHTRRTEGTSYSRDRFEAPVVSTCVHKYVEMQRHLFVTEGGYVGAAPLGTQRGDEVWVLFGCSIPLLLRRSLGGRYRVVGECYVHGFMYGEVMVDLESGKRKDCMIELE